MPLPRSKHRISKLVADLQSPAKRRGSMVVETGFPTSLVDLFVKNRDRLRRASSKHHRRGSDSSDLQFTNSPPIEQTIPPPSSPMEAIADVDIGDQSLANRVLAAVLKAMVVVALALSTKKLVVGFTLSAFALLILESAGNYIDFDLHSLKPCSRLLDLIQTALSIFQPERCKASKVLETAMAFGSIEIESVTVSNLEDEIGGNEACFDSSYVDMKIENRNIVKNQSRSRRIKSKIIKKLRDLRKKKNMKKSEMTLLEVDDTEMSGYFSTEEQEDCEEDKLGGEDINGDESQIDRQLSRERLGRERQSGYEMLVLIALVGLVGGRIWGFALTVVWCIALKSKGITKCAHDQLSYLRSNFE